MDGLIYNLNILTCAVRNCWIWEEEYWENSRESHEYAANYWVDPLLVVRGSEDCREVTQVVTIDGGPKVGPIVTQ